MYCLQTTAQLHHERTPVSVMRFHTDCKDIICLPGNEEKSQTHYTNVWFSLYTSAATNYRVHGRGKATVIKACSFKRFCCFFDFLNLCISKKLGAIHTF